MEEPKVVGIEEIAIAVRDADRAAEYFRDLFGMDFSFGWEIEGEKIMVKSEPIVGTQLQFIQATEPDSVVARFVNQRGEGLNHFAFRVTNLEEMVRRLKEKGVRLVPDHIIEVDIRQKNMPLGGEKVKFIFIHPQSAFGALIELIEA